METYKNRNRENRGGIILAACLAMCMLSCSKKLPVESVDKQSSYKDTVLEIDSLNFPLPKGSSKLTEELAQETLEKYYAVKGIHNYKTGYQDEEGNQMCAYYDTLYTYQLNNDKHEDGIIAYHLMPCLASGHCYQPGYAFITRINNEYKIVNPEFLTSGYGIDSLTTEGNLNYLYFYRFDCGENEVMQHYKAKLNRK
ncbi:MAG: hypothetical protein ACOVRN_02955 [Flavobacterium sp.]